MIELTQEILRELVDYNRDTGVFTWRFRSEKWFTRINQFKTWNKRFAGRQITRTSDKGYILVAINGRQYTGHRLAWLYEHGAWPAGEIDHINHDRLDNRLANLRDVSRAENMKNKSPYRAGEPAGVGRNKGRWVAYICAGKAQKSLGYFDNKADAIAARVAAERTLGFHENHGVAA